MPRPIAVSPAICRACQIRDTIRWLPSKWPFLARSALIGVSSYTKRLKKAGMILGIELIDHIIITPNGRVYSIIIGIFELHIKP
jgi:hypothetical protein